MLRVLNAGYQIDHIGQIQNQSSPVPFVFGTRIAKDIPIPSFLVKLLNNTRKENGIDDSEIKMQFRLSLLLLPTGAPIGRTFSSAFVSPSHLKGCSGGIPYSSMADEDPFYRADVRFTEDTLMVCDVVEADHVAIVVEVVAAVVYTNPQGEVALSPLTVGWTANCSLFQLLRDHSSGRKKLPNYPEPCPAASFKLWPHTTSPRYLLSGAVTTRAHLAAMSKKHKDKLAAVYCAVQPVDMPNLSKIGQYLPRNRFVSRNTVIPGIARTTGSLAIQIRWDARPSGLDDLTNVPPAPDMEGTALLPFEEDPKTLTLTVQKVKFVGLSAAIEKARLALETMRHGTSSRALGYSVTFIVHNSLKAVSTRTTPLQGDTAVDEVAFTMPLQHHCFLVVAVTASLETETAAGPYGGSVTVCASSFAPFDPKTNELVPDLLPIWTAVTLSPMPLPWAAELLHLPQALCATEVEITAEVKQDLPQTPRRGPRATPKTPVRATRSMSTSRAVPPSPLAAADRSGLFTDGTGGSTFVSLSRTESMLGMVPPATPATPATDFNPTIGVCMRVDIKGMRFVGQPCLQDQFKTAVDTKNPTVSQDHDRYIKYRGNLELILFVGQVAQVRHRFSVSTQCQPGVNIDTGRDLVSDPIVLTASNPAPYGGHPVFLELRDNTGHSLGRMSLYSGIPRPFKRNMTAILAYDSMPVCRREGFLDEAVEVTADLEFSLDVPRATRVDDVDEADLTIVTPLDLAENVLTNVGVYGAVSKEVLAMLVEIGPYPWGVE
ncbi:hypothetical protein J8273_1223 [Carpediemonas membranifera]|uniref:Uncharacterized protein n=1 Tax=Carpediemonas membranifera TaxID=201153 RepID=A0A8J6B7M2_9EUKA|nr:hypothetical protein J8273_1223 [Carpediemonas membranifera]|eukprot:KAG9397308.1 hypothetical protein J8273_1223 [Carpediemonas membranifera]